MAQEISKSYLDPLPYIYNGTLMVGHMNMPSARMNAEGMLAIGYGHISPYNNVSVNVQPFTRLELSASYRIFPGQTEQNLSQYGFGDDADRTANFKILLLSRNDGNEWFPEISFAAEDFHGTKRFEAYYLIASKSWRFLNMETTFGWGWQRVKGPFGAINWTPFAQTNAPLLNGITLIAEYDATDYENHYWEHGDGRKVDSRINLGVSATIMDTIQLKAGTQRGNSIAVQGSINYNLGDTQGLLPKTQDAPLWQKPIDYEPLGHLRSERELAQQFAYAFQEQGLTLATLYLTENHGLWIKLLNIKYRQEPDLKKRLENILSALTPDNITTVTAVVEANGVPTQQYTFRYTDLSNYRNKTIGREELNTLSPMKIVQSPPTKYESVLLFRRKKPVWTYMFRPRLLSFFGSSRGKYKYSFGLLGGLSGYLFDSLYYDTLVSFRIKATIDDIQDRDFYNPSRRLNVRTDAIRYFQGNRLNLDRAFIQKGWNTHNGFFFRLAGGYFEPMYGGLAGETLYYPANAQYAIGFEAASVLKRDYDGLGFMHKVRKLQNGKITYHDYVGYQYFLNLYYYFKLMNMEVSAKTGQFLARDFGTRFEVARYYPSGMRLSFWYTLTNGKDVVNGSRYYDKGVAINFPLDIFLQKSSRSMLGYAMGFWLRDVGAYSMTGIPLYQTINRERRGYVHNLY